jgi:4-amino-4-deoxy-L-arabinose transferase-like glycosyltransferase
MNRIDLALGGPCLPAHRDGPTIGSPSPDPGAVAREHPKSTLTAGPKQRSWLATGRFAIVELSAHHVRPASHEKDHDMTSSTLDRPEPVTDGAALITAPQLCTAAAAAPPGKHRGRLGRTFLGPTGDPRWARPALWALLLATGGLYLIDLTASGYANEFYAAAVQAGTQSWKALLFGSLDSGNAITVDKPPASIWVMALSGRILGFSSFSLLLPQALMGVGTVSLTHATVKRWSGPAAGLVAGGLVALTPVAALMFRFDNPDALLVLLMTLAAYCVVRAIDMPNGRKALRWLVFAGVALGLAFLTKMLQGLLVLPAFGLAYLVAAPISLGKRLGHLLAAAGALIVSAGWYVALVALWPADSRPYIGGSQTNSLWELAIGYNGLSRIFGGGGNGGGGGGNVGFGGATGLTRLFGTSFGSEISWLLPAALIGLVAGFWFTRRLPRTDKIRASLIIWGGWLVVTGLVFSYMSGTVHPYYSVALAPAIAATVAVAGRELWRGHGHLWVRAVLALMIAATGVWSFYLLGRDTAGWLPWLRWVTLIGSLAGAALLMVGVNRLRRLALVGVLVGSLTAVAGTAAFTVATAATPHSGSIPTSGPSGYSSGMGGGAGGPGGPGAGGFGGGRAPDGSAGTGNTGPGTTGAGTTGTGNTGPGTTGTGRTGSGTGQAGGAGAASTSDIDQLLTSATTRWAAAVIGSQSAANYELATGASVMAIGGFTGSDPSPTLAEFQQYVANGEIRYFIAGGGMGGSGGNGSGAEIAQWVEATFTATTVGDVTVYDLTGGSTS